MSYEGDFYPESRFGGYTHIDGTVAFYSRVHALLSPSSVVLDVGCGRGRYLEDPVPFRRDLRILKGKAGRVIGMDVDPAARENPCIDEFIPILGETWSLADGSIDLIVCDNVLEHLAEPATLFREARRVLRPGGVLCLRTPNAWNYIALLARLIPNRFHARVTARVQAARQAQDVFPTLYRCNTLKRIARQLKAHGFTEYVLYGYEAEPSYLSFNRFAYWLGVLHQKVAPGIFKATLVGFARKPLAQP